jgi:hypothetical protein
MTVQFNRRWHRAITRSGMDVFGFFAPGQGSKKNSKKAGLFV